MTRTALGSPIIGFGRYNLLVKLGQGGMGAVFLARHKALRRFCAIKVISPGIAQDPGSTERFLREARATASLAHPNLNSVFDCDQFDGQSFIAMEYVAGMSLAEIIRAHGALPLPLALDWLIQAATALEYIHGRHVIHRDIKPDNMMVDATGKLKIMDLGLAKDCFDPDQNMTMTGMILGSPRYMSPEQINDSKTADHRSDLYSLGISFFQMLAGHVPFQHSSSSLVCIAHLQEPIPSLNLPASELTQALDVLIGRMTAKDKAERFQSAAEILAAIQPLARQNPMDAASQQIFSSLGFEGRTAACILDKNGILESEVDVDCAPPPSPNQAVAPAPAIAPVAPTPAAARPPYGKWIAIGLAGCILVLLGLKLMTHSKSHESKRAVTLPQNPEPPKPQPPVPAPEPVAKLGGLLVRTQPEKAIVMLGSESQPSPASFPNKPVGKYTIQISLDGYQDVQKEVTVEENRFSEVNIPLTPLKEPEEQKQTADVSPQTNPKLQQKIDGWIERLDKATQVDDRRWPNVRRQTLEKMSNFLMQKGVPRQVVGATAANVGVILDRARAASPDVYNAEKQKMARDILSLIGEAFGSGRGWNKPNAQPDR